MPDLRTLLDEASARAPRAADPVGAVHAAVRRRAHRRRAGLAAGVAAGSVAAGTVVAAGPDERSVTPAAPAPSATAGAPATAWRFPPHDSGPDDRRYAADYAALYDLVRAHPDVFYAVTVQGSDRAPGWQVTVAFGSDVDTERWEDRVLRAAGDIPRVAMKRCGQPVARYDAVAAEMRAAAFPSGARLVAGPYPHAVTYEERCAVFAGLLDDAVDPRDAAYARERWGRVAYLHAKPPPTPLPWVTPNADGTYG